MKEEDMDEKLQMLRMQLPVICYFGCVQTSCQKGVLTMALYTKCYELKGH